MNWPWLSAYVIAGVGVAIGMHCNLDHRSDWRGSTQIVGLILMFVFWPVPIVALLTIALAARAER